MPQRPLLPLPSPSAVAPPPGPRGGQSIRVPSRSFQAGKFGPTFTRLRAALSSPAGTSGLSADPTSLAPERVIVFEIAGMAAEFFGAVAHIPSLEFMAELEGDFEPDQDFALKDGRKGKKGQDRTDKRVSGRFYLAMPDVRALEELIRLWRIWESGGNLPTHFAGFRDLFKQLRDVRPWGPQDRIPQETLEYWREEIERQPDRPIRTEVELWYRDSQARRDQVVRTMQAIVSDAGGSIVHQSVIGEIAYHGMLIDIPAVEVQSIISSGSVQLALADEVMFLRPQSTFRQNLEIDPEADRSGAAASGPLSGAPIAALLDGVPVQAHALLDGRLVFDDPDNLQSRALVTGRIHGTAMASLILHGDRNEGGDALTRPLYVRPLMLVNQSGREEVDGARLFTDTLYRAVLRIKGSEGETAAAPSVFLVNLSMGDARRPFARTMSPLARLLDFLSARYNILFLVSGGNVLENLEIPEFPNWSSFKNAPAKDRQKAVLKALHNNKHERTILSPAESLNALTIGAQHQDNIQQRPAPGDAVDPFEDGTLPNVTSGLGLGHRRMIKPDLYFPGGREFLQMKTSGGGVTARISNPGRLYGLSAAAPDYRNRGQLNEVALTAGTSPATALATRSAHRIFDAIMDRDGGSLLADMDPQYFAVVLKALLVHSAKWNGNEELLKEICGPFEGHRHPERAENVSRFLGFGVPHIIEVLECASNRATLVGYGSILPETAQKFRIPLPACLERVTEPRSLTVTVAWLSPIKPGHQKYRSIKLEADSIDPSIQALGVKRGKSQPSDNVVKRGSVFHERHEGKSAVPFIDDGHLSLRVWCKEDAGLSSQETIRYGVAVTIEAGTELPVYDQIQTRLRIRPPA
jgi:hypothetical protein